METLIYTIVLEKNEDGGYTVTVPALSGCVTQGSNLAEAASRAKEAIECHLEGLYILQLPIPQDCKTIEINAEYLSEAFVSKVTVEPEYPTDTLGEKVA